VTCVKPYSRPMTFPKVGSDDTAAIRFPEWLNCLDQSALPNEVRESHRSAIFAFLRYCKNARTVATVVTIRAYLDRSKSAADRAALRWFFRASRAQADHQSGVGIRRSEIEVRRSGGEQEFDTREAAATDPTPRAANFRSGVPPLAARDQGGADWERDLVSAVRARGFLWRTEETYRAWAARFAQFVRPRSPYAATAQDVGAFLSSLAVKQRAMPSTQKQALNAIVFLMQEALHRELGEIPFQRAAPRRRVPTVLTKEECQRLFNALTGTTQLMAELMYGSGLRLLELLRLRVHHVDLERRQLKICGAKGDKDRVTMLPEQLRMPLREHIERLRGLHQADREAGLPGVWLPEGLARKFQNAGETWEWQWLFPSRETSVDPVSRQRGPVGAPPTSVGRLTRNAGRRAELGKRLRQMAGEGPMCGANAMDENSGSILLPMNSTSTVSKTPTHEQIATRARALWETRGRPANRDEEIWLEAERLLVGELDAQWAPLKAAPRRDPDHIDPIELNDALDQFGEPTRRSPTSVEPT
jgi:integrase